MKPESTGAVLDRLDQQLTALMPDKMESETIDQAMPVSNSISDLLPESTEHHANPTIYDLDECGPATAPGPKSRRAPIDLAAPTWESDEPVVEIDGARLPLGLALAILAALDGDMATIEALRLRPENVRAALMNAARRVLAES